jgi:hypothetical protein
MVSLKFFKKSVSSFDYHCISIDIDLPSRCTYNPADGFRKYTQDIVLWGRRLCSEAMSPAHRWIMTLAKSHIDNSGGRSLLLKYYKRNSRTSLPSPSFWPHLRGKLVTMVSDKDGLLIEQVDFFSTYHPGSKARAGQP